MMISSKKKTPSKKSSKSLSGLKIRSTLKGGGLSSVNHSRASQGLKIRSTLKGGGLSSVNHNRALY
jgi:hypothetical protein